MKILHLIKTVSTGGAELHLLRLCRRLKADGIDVVVACLREAVPGTRSLRPDFERGGIRVIDLETAGGRGFLLAWALPRLLRDERPHILHTHLPRADLAGAFGRWRVPVPWVVTVHGIYETHWSGRHLLPVFDRLWRRADALICTSEVVRTWLVGSRGLPSAKACVVHHGIETEVFREAGTDFRAAWGLDGRPIIGTVGRMEPGKGHDVLIRGMAELVRDVPDALLLIAGPDPWGYQVRLEALVGSLNLNGHVRFVGFQQDIPSFLQALDVFGFGSRSEGFGQVVIETMAAGKPVVATRVPPFPEIVADGDTGILVEPDNPSAFAHALLTLLRNPATARRMGHAGQLRAEDRFTAARMADSVLQVYRRVLRIL